MASQSEHSITTTQVMQHLMKSQSKVIRDYLQTFQGLDYLSLRENVSANLDQYSPSALLEDIHALFAVAGLKFFFNRPEETLRAELTRPEEGDPRPPPPQLEPQGVTGAMEAAFKAEVGLLAGFASERPEEMPFYRSGGGRVWSLQQLGMEAIGGLLKREDDRFNSFLNARLIPEELQHDFQQILPLDVPVFKAALAVDEGVFWKRLMEKKYPYIYCNPKIEITTYKSVFLQEWFSDYISSLEPGNISYNDVKKVALAVSIWVFDLNIKSLKPPKFRKTRAPKRNLPEKEWELLDKETCLLVNPYPDKINIAEVLKCLGNLRRLSLCYGFENYEREPKFQHTRVSKKDMTTLGSGLSYCRRLVALRLHKSAIYSQDVQVFCQFLAEIPLKRLEISTCFVDDSGVLAISNVLRCHKFLEVLDLRRNRISENGAYYLGVALIEKNVTPLRSLDLSFNKIGNIGALHMGLMLSLSKTLASLELVGCGMGPPGGRVLGAALRHNKLLLRLDLTGNDVGEEAAAGAASHPRLERAGLSRPTERRNRARNRSYVALRWFGRGERYRLAELRAGLIPGFPSYSVPREEASPSDTESEVTEAGGYHEDPILTRYAGEFEQQDDQGRASRVYARYLTEKAKSAVKQGLEQLYRKGTPLMKLINAKASVPHPPLINHY